MIIPNKSFDFIIWCQAYLLFDTWFDVKQNQMNELVILAILPANHFKMTDWQNCLIIWTEKNPTTV